MPGVWNSGCPRMQAHTCLLTWLFHSREKTALGVIWPTLLATCLWFHVHQAWCVFPSGPRPTLVFNPWHRTLVLAHVLQKTVLAFTCSGTDSHNSPLCSFLPVTNENLLFPEIEDLEKGAFMRCPVSVVAFALVASCCCWLVWLRSRLSSRRGPSHLLPYLSTPGLAPGSSLLTPKSSSYRHLNSIAEGSEKPCLCLGVCKCRLGPQDSRGDVGGREKVFPGPQQQL